MAKSADKFWDKITDKIRQKKAERIERKRINKLTRELIYVVKNPDETAVEKINALVKQGADVNTFDMDTERSLTHFAAEQNRFDIVKALDENGCKKYINVNDIYGKDPAFYAIDNHNPQMLDYLHSHGVSTNRPADLNLISSFRHAVRSGHIDLAEIELKHGADINDHIGEHIKLYDKYEIWYSGPSPLAEVVKGQAANFKADDTPTEKRYDMAMIEFLVKNGARTDFKDAYGDDVKYIESWPNIRKIMVERQNTINAAALVAKNNVKSI